jgi:hypothetical protein
MPPPPPAGQLGARARACLGPGLRWPSKLPWPGLAVAIGCLGYAVTPPPCCSCSTPGPPGGPAGRAAGGIGTRPPEGGAAAARRYLLRPFTHGSRTFNSCVCNGL